MKTLALFFSRKNSVVACFLLLLTGMILPDVADAQHRNRDAVYLKNGSVVTGRLMAYDSLNGIRITNSCGIWYYPFNEADSVRVFADLEQRRVRKTGYFNYSSAALFLGSGLDGFRPLTSLTMVNGWQYGQRFFAGLGVGYEFYDWDVLPLFAEVRFHFRPAVVSPFLSFRAGYGFPLSRTYSPDNYYGLSGKTYGGVQLNPELGILVPVGQSNSLMIGLGYHYQELSYQNPSNYWIEYQSAKVITYYNRISLRFGFLFQ